VVVSGRYHVDRAGRVARVLDERAGFDGLERAAEFIRAHHGAADGRIQGLVVLDEFYNASPALLRQAKATAGALGVGLTMHFAEQLVEFFETVRGTGKTPVGVLEAEGILGPEVLLAHTVYVAGHRATAYPHGGDLEALAASGTTVVHSPLGLARRGVALESFQRYLEAGINVALGTDAYPLDMFGEMRTAAVVAKLVEQNHEAGRAADVFAASNLGGARALGRADLGRLAPGAKADLVLVDLDSLAIGPVADPIRALVHLATPDMVETVICDGRVLLRERRLLVCDEAEVLGAARRSTERVWAGYADYHWGARRLDQEFPPSLPPWQGD
jgi:cytosine/adenosine deaminase-related metal-dependent hydrolase